MKKLKGHAAVLIVWGLLAQAASGVGAFPAGQAGQEPSPERQLAYAREQLIAAGLEEVADRPGVHRFERKAPRFVSIVIEPKRAGAERGSIVLEAAHSRTEGRVATRESLLTFASFSELEERISALKSILGEPAQPARAAAIKCPFARFASRFFPGLPKSHALVQPAESRRPLMQWVMGAD